MKSTPSRSKKTKAIWALSRLNQFPSRTRLITQSQLFHLIIDLQFCQSIQTQKIAERLFCQAIQIRKLMLKSRTKIRGKILQSRKENLWLGLKLAASMRLITFKMKRGDLAMISSEFSNTNNWMKVSKTHFIATVNSMKVTKADPDQTRMKVNLSNQTMIITKLDHLLSLIVSSATLCLSLATCQSSLRSLTIANCAHSVITGGKKRRCTTRRLQHIWRRSRDRLIALHSSQVNQWWVQNH